MSCMRERKYVMHSIYTQSACSPAIKSWRKFGWGKVINVGAWEYFHRDITSKAKKAKYNIESALAFPKEGPVRIPRVDKSLVLSVVLGIMTKMICGLSTLISIERFNASYNRLSRLIFMFRSLCLFEFYDSICYYVIIC